MILRNDFSTSKNAAADQRAGIPGQPGPKMIADAWLAKKAVKNNRVEYFQNNVRDGIRTFEDDEIAGYLRH